jgi:hypothetical protein
VSVRRISGQIPFYLGASIVDGLPRQLQFAQLPTEGLFCVAHIDRARGGSGGGEIFHSLIVCISVFAYFLSSTSVTALNCRLARCPLSSHLGILSIVSARKVLFQLNALISCILKATTL